LYAPFARVAELVDARDLKSFSIDLCLIES